MLRQFVIVESHEFSESLSLLNEVNKAIEDITDGTFNPLNVEELQKRIDIKNNSDLMKIISEYRNKNLDNELKEKINIIFASMKKLSKNFLIIKGIKSDLLDNLLENKQKLDDNDIYSIYPVIIAEESGKDNKKIFLKIYDASTVDFREFWFCYFLMKDIPLNCMNMFNCGMDEEQEKKEIHLKSVLGDWKEIKFSTLSKEAWEKIYNVYKKDVNNKTYKKNEDKLTYIEFIKEIKLANLNNKNFIFILFIMIVLILICLYVFFQCKDEEINMKNI